MGDEADIFTLFCCTGQKHVETCGRTLIRKTSPWSGSMTR